MKAVLVSAIIVALAGGTWTWVAPERKMPSSQQDLRSEAGERVGVKRMLAAREDLRFANLVIGTDREGLRDFRARLIEDGQARPVFGQARKVCDSAPDLAECWEIATLQVDGKRRLPSLGDAITVEPQKTVPRQKKQLEENEIETGDIPVDAPVDKVDPPAPVSPNATHLVARPIINVRGGPGLDNPVLFKLPQGARLGLLSHERGWGKFIILDGESQGAEAWASLSILEALR